MPFGISTEISSQLQTKKKKKVVLCFFYLNCPWLWFCYCCCCCWVASVMANSVRPHRQQPTRLPLPGILQARTLEWVAISFSNAWKWKVKEKSLSRVQLLATPWTAAHQAPLTMGFSRQEYWSGVPLPSPFQRLERKQRYWYQCDLVVI